MVSQDKRTLLTPFFSLPGENENDDENGDDDDANNHEHDDDDHFLHYSKHLFSLFSR